LKAVEAEQIAENQGTTTLTSSMSFLRSIWPMFE